MSSASRKFQDLLRELFQFDCADLDFGIYQDLRTRYDDGAWDRERFAKSHILFREQSAPYDHVARMIDPQEDAAVKVW